MRHIGIAVVAAAALAVIGPHITPTFDGPPSVHHAGKPAGAHFPPSARYARTGEEIHDQASGAAGAPVSMLRMRAGEAPLSRFDRR